MTIRCLADVNAAYARGAFHMQRFQKNAGGSHNNQFIDTSFSSGQPAYDARVGVPNTFTPAIAQKNDAIWFPPIGADEERYLHKVELWGSQATFNGPGSVYLFDLLGYYPLIDGDSTEPQVFDNTLTLPRFADGEGVFGVVVNHVAPATGHGFAEIVMTDHAGVQSTIQTSIHNLGQNLVCTGNQTSATSGWGGIAMAMPPGARGIRSIDQLTYLTPPSGLHCIYLIKPLGTMVLGDNALFAEKDFLMHNGWRMPRIYDGAWLGMFENIGSGTSRTVAWNGNFHFVWG